MKNLLSNFAFVAMFVLLISCDNKEEPREQETQLFKQQEKFYKIDPPIKGMDIPYIENLLENQKKQTLKLKSGTTIEIPNNAFVDKEGNPVQDKINLLYREFKDPLEIMFAGIPMEYDSAGQEYIFESAAMCEVKAFDKDNQPVFLAADKKLTLTIPSKLSGDDFNLYQFDTIAGRWNNIGKDSVIVVNTSPVKEKKKLAPIKPRKTDTLKQHIILDIKDKERFYEFAAFEKIKFELADDSKNKEIDKNTTWYDFKYKRHQKRDSP